ncbi:MAG TPA: DUF4386 domain-containing protein [Thermoanaerobaculia bacterium]|nr:DUF4386 domain-containing protein [Thermoanaerobaculia bacterium]
MQELDIAASPRRLARICGLLYLVIILIGTAGELWIRDGIVIWGDAAATAVSLRAHEALWRWGIVSELFLLICSIVMGLILFVLLRPVSCDLALLALLFNVVNLTLEAAFALHLWDALVPIGSSMYAKAFNPQQLAALSSLQVRSHAHGFNMSLLFFGCYCLLTGYLIFRSGYLPRTIGVLMQIAGVGYLLNTLAQILAPRLANQLGPAILLPALVGEGSVCLWLLIKGVDVERWRAREGRAMASP